MATLDIVILVYLGVCIFVGARNGIIRQLGGIIGLFLGIYLSYKFSSALSGYLSEWVKVSETAMKVISFALIMIGTLVLMSLLGRLLESLFSAVAINWINRLLGIILSLGIGVLLLGVVLFIINYIDQNWFGILGESQISDSKLAETILSISDKVFPYLKKLF